jgi:tetratricopeptide (TPR) repeat protein
MTDGVFPDRLSQLRARWEADPSSRIFLQLAEEYRHLGRVQDALAVLDKGLKEHPGYLSALVAKGRCHIELGEAEAARLVLERVVKQDATQMVANKLLVRAYLETGDPVKARERLDLYTLLNDSDPEIEELRRRIRQLEAPVQPVFEPEIQPDVQPEPRLEARPEGASPLDADPFSLEPPPRPSATPPPLPSSLLSPAPAASGDIFDLDAAPAPLRGGDDIFQLDPAPPPVTPPSTTPPPVTPPPIPSAARADDLFELDPTPLRATAEEDSDLLFPEAGSRESRRRYLDALSSEGLFSFDPAPAAPSWASPPPLPQAAVQEPEPFAVFPDTATPLPAFAPVQPEPERFPEPEPEPFSFEPAPAPRIEEASWLDEAAASSSFASSPVPVLPLEPLAPAILAPIAPVPAELQAPEVREPEAAEAAPTTVPETAEDLWSDEPRLEAEPEPVFEEPPLFEEPPPFQEELAPLEEPVPVEEPAGEPPATATLGDLYLRQGYHAEAERIYREVLEREPDSTAAAAGLERVAALGPRPEPAEVDARRLLVGYRPNPGLPADAELRARKAWVLNRYLERLRQGDMHDVS